MEPQDDNFYHMLKKVCRTLLVNGERVDTRRL